jgi:hypothetical protein
MQNSFSHEAGPEKKQIFDFFKASSPHIFPWLFSVRVEI